MKSKEKKPMSLGRKILSAVIKAVLILIAMAIVAVTVFAIMFWDTFVTVVKNPALIPYVIENRDTLSKGLNTSSEDIEAEKKANTDAQVRAFEDANIGLTADDITSLEDENLSEEERAQIIYQAMVGAEAVLPEDESTSSENGVNDGVSDNASSQSGEENENNDALSENKTSQGAETSSTSQTNEADKTKTENKPVEDKTPVSDSKPTSEKNNTSEVKPAVNNKPTVPGKPSAAPGASSGTNPNGGRIDSQKNNADMPSVNIPVTSPETGASYAGMTDEQYNVKVSELVAKMYSIKSDFNSKLASFESGVKSEYWSLPVEQRTMAAKARIVSENMSYIMGLEAQCDAQVKAVTDELTAIMTANGKPTTLVDQINAAYINEKELKKSYYISLYK